MTVADVALVVEGSYPFVPGGVSSWVQQVLTGLPELRFAVVSLSSHPGAHGPPRYPLPENLVELAEAFCQPVDPQHTRMPPSHVQQEIVRRVRARNRGPTRVGHALQRLLVGEPPDDALVADLMAGDLDVPGWLHGDHAFEVVRAVAEQRAPQASFLDVFWHTRGMAVPVLHLLGSRLPLARCYHAVSTGYAGLVATAASVRQGVPMLLTEHGLYTRERQMELSRAAWLRGPGRRAADSAALQQLWAGFFLGLSRLAYHQSTRIVTLSEVNRRKQLDDGASWARTRIIPNGVTVPDTVPSRTPAKALRVGFVGRVVSIKDVATFIHGCHRALQQVPLDVRIYGPEEEEPVYAARCHHLVESLKRTQSIRFMGPQPAAAIYAAVDVVVLTSFSEGQPLVILEASAAGLPVVASDVGGCRELLEGGSARDRALGPSGLLTRAGHPEDTAAALVRLARDPALRQTLGTAGRTRVTRFYQRQGMLDAYRAVYREMGEAWQASAGSSRDWWSKAPCAEQPRPT